MKRIYLIMILLLNIKAFAQDSEWLQLQKTGNDTNKVNRLLQFVEKHLDEGGTHYKNYLADILNLSRKLNYKKGIVASLNDMGYFNQRNGNYEEAMIYFRKGYEEAKQWGDNNFIGKGLMNIGAINEMRGNRDSAIIYHMNAVPYLEKGNNLKFLSHLFLNLGILHGNTRNPEKSVEYKRKAAAYARQAGDTSRLIKILSELGRAYSTLGKHKEEENAAREAVFLAGITNNKKDLADAYNVLASYYYDTNQPDSSIVACKAIIKNAGEAKQAAQLIEGYLSLSEAYDLKNDQQGRLSALKTGLKTCESTENVVFLDDYYQGMADANFKLNHFKEAYLFYQKFTLFKDSVFNERNVKTVSELEIKYQTAQKEKTLSHKQLQLAQKDLQLQKNRNYMYYSLTAFLVALLVAVILYIHYRHKKMVHAKEIKTIQQQKELQLLQALMQGEEKERSRIAKDLHDGVAGMLAAVKLHFSSIPLAEEKLLKAEGYQKGMRLLNDATQEIRKTSHNLMPEVLLQHGLDEALRRYCNNVNNSKTLQLQYDSWGEIDRFADSFELSVYRIVQELVNNIIKHSKATQAMVQLSQQNDLLSISIEDNGIGFEKEKTSEGMGLSNLQNRIKAMNGRIEMQVSDQTGVSAYLEFEISELKTERTSLYV